MMTLCGSQMFRRANLALVPLTVLLVSHVAHAAPPTAITTCPFRIETPGQYYLAMDLTCPGTGITILASDVYLRLDGHTLQGLSPGDGIQAVFATDIVIQGPGTITGFSDGVTLDFVDFSTVIGVTATRNSVGFEVNGANNLLLGNEATLNGIGIAIFFGSENTIVNNFLMNNSGGIDLVFANLNKIYANTANSNLRGITLIGSTQNEIHGNTALGNSDQDMFDNEPDCDDNQWQGNRFDTANQSCIQ
jgi:parallel beta-helix repeat protein